MHPQCTRRYDTEELIRKEIHIVENCKVLQIVGILPCSNPADHGLSHILVAVDRDK